MNAASNTLGSIRLGLAKRLGRLAGWSNAVAAVRKGATVRAIERERH